MTRPARRLHIPILSVSIAAILFFPAGCSFWVKPTTTIAYTRVATLAGLDRQLGEPFGIATRDGVVYFSDGEAGTIVKLLPDGGTEILASGLNTPSGIAFLPNGDLVVADTGSHSIKKVSPAGVVSLLAGIENVAGSDDGSTSIATFNGPIGVASDRDGAVYVSDTYNDRIRLIRDGSVSTVAGSGRGFHDGAGSSAMFDTPLGLAHWHDKLLVADSGNGRIRVVEPDGNVWTLAGTGDGGFRDGPPLQASFLEPTAVATDANGRIFVADGNAIRVIGRRAFPYVETLSGERRGYSDGRSLQARFNRPSGIAIGEGGGLLVADSDNQVVRVFSDGGGREVTLDEILSRRMTAAQFRSLQPPRWPYDPPLNPREVAGTLGEIRGEISEANKPTWFHNGLDIAGAYGEAAKFIRTETVLDPHAAQNFGTSRELLRMPTLGYIHLRIGRDMNDEPFTDPRFQVDRDLSGKLSGIRVRRGTKFAAGDLLGTLNAMNHVHLIAGRPGGEMNALDALELPGVADSVPPVVEAVSLFTADWREIETESGHSRIKLNDKVRVVVRAYDRMDGNAERRRLGVYRVGYQLISNGVPPNDIDWTISFERMPSNDAVKFAYAPGSRSGATGETVFSYIASNRVDGDGFGEDFLDAAKLNNGNYILRIFAADLFGNIASKDTNFEVVK